jgi:hypothetical protein
VFFARGCQNQWIQASAAMLIRSALFWGIKHRRMVIFYWRFGTTYRSHLQGSRSPGDPIRCPETSVKVTIQRCVIPQKRPDLKTCELYMKVRPDYSCLGSSSCFVSVSKCGWYHEP